MMRFTPVDDVLWLRFWRVFFRNLSWNNKRGDIAARFLELVPQGLFNRENSAPFSLWRKIFGFPDLDKMATSFITEQPVPLRLVGFVAPEADSQFHQQDCVCFGVRLPPVRCCPAYSFQIWKF